MVNLPSRRRTHENSPPSSFNRATEQKRVFDRISIVPVAPRNCGESPRPVQRQRGHIRLTHLENNLSRPAVNDRREYRIEQLAAETPPTLDGTHREVEDLGLIRCNTGDYVASDRLHCPSRGDKKDSVAHVEKLVERVFGPRVAERRVLDFGDRRNIVRRSGSDTR